MQSREPIFNVPRVVVALIAVLALVHGVREILLSDEIDWLLVRSLAFVPARYGARGLIDGVIPGGLGAEIWSFFSYAFLHADWLHLGLNAVWLLAFGSPVALRFGPLRFIVLFIVSVAAGAFVHLALNDHGIMIGASAGVSGMMGAAVRFVFEPGGLLGSWYEDRRAAVRVPAASLGGALRKPAVIAFVAVWFGLNLLFGLGLFSIAGMEERAVAWEAHIGGFLAGLLLFSYFDPVGRPANRR